MPLGRTNSRHVFFLVKKRGREHDVLGYFYSFTVLFGEDTLLQWNLQHEIPIRDGEIFMHQWISVLVYG